MKASPKLLDTPLRQHVTCSEPQATSTASSWISVLHQQWRASSWISALHQQTRAINCTQPLFLSSPPVVGSGALLSARSRAHACLHVGLAHVARVWPFTRDRVDVDTHTRVTGPAENSEGSSLCYRRTHVRFADAAIHDKCRPPLHRGHAALFAAWSGPGRNTLHPWRQLHQPLPVRRP